MIQNFLHCRLLGLLILGFAVAGNTRLVWGHDVPDRFFDRAIEVTIRPESLRIKYQLCLTQLTLAEELISLVGTGGVSGTGSAERMDIYAAKMGPLLAHGLLVKLDRNELPVPVRFIAASHRVEDHPRFQFEMEVVSEPGIAAQHQILFEDTNFFLEKGRLRIAIHASPPCELENSSVPMSLDEVPVKASWEMTPEQQDATRRAAASWRQSSAAADLPGDSASEGILSDPPDIAIAASQPTLGNPQATSKQSGLLGLLDRRSGNLAIILAAVAFFFGAAHAMTPGHGKTMVAAYLIGERGTLRHAIGLGLATSLTHTGSVLAVAIVLALLGPALEQKMNTGLSLLSGLLVAGLGAGLLFVRLRARYRHSSADLAGSDSEHHCCQHGSPGEMTTATLTAGPTWSGMLALGVSGGIVPCWDAVALLLFAAAEGQVARALYLLVSFSAGLASALVSVGILAVKLRGYLSSRVGSGRIVQILPIVSAAAILVVGLYLCTLTLHQPLDPERLAAPAAHQTDAP